MYGPMLLQVAQILFHMLLLYTINSNILNLIIWLFVKKFDLFLIQLFSLNYLLSDPQFLFFNFKHICLLYYLYQIFKIIFNIIPNFSLIFEKITNHVYMFDIFLTE